jgi:PAS domain-containing protein
MHAESKADKTERILVCAPFGRDSDLIRRELEEAGFSTSASASIEELCAGLKEGAGAALIGDQAFAPPGAVRCLAEALAEQPAWSDVPVLVFISGGGASEKKLEISRWLQSLGRVMLLERPLSPASLISSLQAAVRARRQQYQIRDYVKHLEESQKALRESEARMRFFIENAPAAITMFDREMRYLAASRRWMEVYGITGDVTGRLHCEVSPAMPEARKEAHRRADGTIRWLTRDVIPRYTEAGEIGGIFIATEDVTSSIRMEQALREKQFRTLANAMSNLAWMAAPSGWVFWYNQRWYEYGHNPEKYGRLGLAKCARSRVSAGRHGAMEALPGHGRTVRHGFSASRREWPVSAFSDPRGAGERLPGKSGSLVWNKYGYQRAATPGAGVAPGE